MSAKGKRRKAKGRSDDCTFLRLRHDLLDSDAYRSLSPYAVKLLIDVARQYNGYNNGALKISWHQLKNCGWTSQTTLQKAKCELAVETMYRGRLVHGAGLIMQTRQYSKGRKSLYALTWERIDDCKGAHDLKATLVAPGQWRDFKKNENHLHEMENCSPRRGEVDQRNPSNQGASSPQRGEVEAKNPPQPLHHVETYINLPRSLRLPALQY